MLRGYPAILLLFISLLSPKLWAAKYHYSYIPRQVYVNEVFPITLLVTDIKDNQHIMLQFNPKSKIQPLFNKPLIQNNGKHSRFYTFYFKAGKEDFSIPHLYIDDGERKGVMRKIYIPVAHFDFPPEKKWSGVIASSFKVKNSQVSNYDEKNNLIYIVIEANEANLEDMHIPRIKEQGLEKLDRKLSKEIAEYYFVIPAKTTKVEFSYYDSIKEQLVPITINTSYIHKTTVAQEVDLNPVDSGFTKVKRYTVIGLVIFFFLVFLLKRDKFYLIALIVSIYALVKFYMPLDKVCVSEGSKLYILPIPSSTVSTILEKRKELPILNRYKDYYKIEYNPGLIGWIKESDVCKN